MKEDHTMNRGREKMVITTVTDIIEREMSKLQKKDIIDSTNRQDKMLINSVVLMRTIDAQQRTNVALRKRNRKRQLQYHNK